MKRRRISFYLMLFPVIALFVGFYQIIGVQGIYESSGTDGAKEITLFTKEMSFSGENPILFLQPGQLARLKIRNEDKGILHDFVIQGLDSLTSGLLQFGDEKVLSFKFLEEGEYTYFCSVHPQMMRGKIIVNKKEQE